MKKVVKKVTNSARNKKPAVAMKPGMGTVSKRATAKSKRPVARKKK